MFVLDLINGLFEFGAFLMIANHCRVLHKDKIVRGVSIWSTIFFVLWGFWNIIYYPSLGQFWSFIAGILVVVTNCIWVGMMIYYRHQEQKNTQTLK